MSSISQLFSIFFQLFHLIFPILFIYGSFTVYNKYKDNSTLCMIIGSFSVLLSGLIGIFTHLIYSFNYELISDFEIFNNIIQVIHFIIGLVNLLLPIGFIMFIKKLKFD